MDEHNVHQFWGISPAVDFLALLEAQSSKQAGAGSGGAAERENGNKSGEPIRILQSSIYDCRHTLQTIGRTARHPEYHGRPVHFYMHEEDPEILARHMLLLAIFFDHQVAARDRMELLLELHGNALLR